MSERSNLPAMRLLGGVYVTGAEVFDDEVLLGAQGAGVSKNVEMPRIEVLEVAVDEGHALLRNAQ
jgi:hypothetical protein